MPQPTVHAERCWDPGPHPVTREAPRDVNKITDDVGAARSESTFGASLVLPLALENVNPAARSFPDSASGAGQRWAARAGLSEDISAPTVAVFLLCLARVPHLICPPDSSESPFFFFFPFCFHAGCTATGSYLCLACIATGTEFSARDMS